MGTGVRDLYNLAINGRGYTLRGVPDNPAYSRSTVASEVNRLAISDLAYSDFSGAGLFFLAQTDWSNGFKKEKTWVDDGKYYYSTNIDTYSDPGVIKLEKQVSVLNDFSENIICGGYFRAGASSTFDSAEYVGTEDNGSGYPQIYKRTGVSTWTAIAATDFGTAKNGISALISHKGKLFAGSVGTINAFSVAYWDNSSWTDVTSAINTATSGSDILSARCFEEVGDTLYVGCGDSTNDIAYIVSTSDLGATFTEEVSIDTDGFIVSIKNFGGKLYYVLLEGTTATLRVFDPSGPSDAEVVGGVFYNAGIPSLGASNVLRVYQGRLIISLGTRVYYFDGNSIIRIIREDDNKASIGREASFSSSKGAVENDGNLIWGNLIYDGEVFFNHKKPVDESTDVYLVPLYVDSEDNIRYIISAGDQSVLYENSSNYKSTLAENFIVFNEMAPVSKIDKLLYSANILFDPLQANEQIKVEYSIDGMDSWVTLDTLTSATEGSATKKEIFLPTNVIFNRIWWRISMAGTTTTPRITDFVMAYKPMPDYKNRWVARLDMADSIKLLNGQNEQRSGNDLLSELWVEKISKQKVLFEDIDYCECNLTASMSATATSAAVTPTRLFPRQGRMRIVSGGVAEEITYTSAFTNKLLGITRGVRGTKARAYTSGQLVSNSYDVYVDSIRSESNFTDENKTESIAQVTLIEA